MSDSAAILSEVTELAAPFLRQMLDHYLSIGQCAEDVDLKSKEFKAEATHHRKAAVKEVAFANRLYRWTITLGKHWDKVILPKLHSILKVCTIDLGLKLIRSLPGLTKKLSSDFVDRAPEITSEIVDEIYELVGMTGRIELSTSEINRIIKRFSVVPDSGETVKFSGDDGQVVVATVLSCNSESDKICIKEFDGFEKIISRGEKLLKLVPQPQTEDFCLVQGGSYRSQVGILESCDSGIATVRLLPSGSSKQIELSLLAKISAKKAGAAMALLGAIDRCEKAETISVNLDLADAISNKSTLPYLTLVASNEVDATVTSKMPQTAQDQSTREAG